METANVTYHDEQGNIKVKIDHDKCITCGLCIPACKHDARYFDDDTGCFFADLAAGVPISVMVAPAIKTNMPDHKRLLTLLKQMGVNIIYDVSIGADICIWAHIKHLRESGGAPIITQPCPVIVTYCQMYRHELLERLSPIHSPMACTSVYMKDYQGITDRIAAISPCLAKADEFEETKLADYNVTFSKLLDYITENNITLPDEETEFDHPESGLGSLFPMPGGFKENIQFFLGSDLHVTRAEGPGIYESLDIYAKTAEEFLPDIYDVLNCDEGCNEGTAALHQRSRFEISKIMKNRGKQAREDYKTRHYETVYNSYEETLDLEKFKREYRAIPTDKSEISEDDIQKAFELLGKFNDEQQHTDCFACGSKTCYDMARKIALKINIPENCIIKSKEDARLEHEENLRVQAQSIENEKMHEADERIRILFDSAPFSAHFWDESLNMTDCNEESAKMFNLSSKDEYISRYFDFMPMYQPDGTKSTDKVRQLIADTFETGFQKAELICLTPDGEPVPVEDTYVRVDYKGTRMVAGYSRDLRVHKQMLKELKETAAEADRQRMEADLANKAKSEFLSHVSHEIRTPMNAVLGTTELQLQKASVPPDFKEAFNTIYSSGSLLLNIINDMLDLSKIEAGKFELNPAAYDIPSIIYDTVQLNLLRYESLPIEFDLLIDENTPLDLFGDELRIKQVLNNILSNAFKYTREGKVELTVSAEIPENQIIENDSDRTHCIIVIKISDTGQGMTEEQIEKLFDEYTRFNTDVNRTVVGTGLGMHIAKRFVDAMNGEIIIESEVGKGSAFTLRIPQERIGTEICGADVVAKLRNSRFRNAMKLHRAQVVHEYMPYGSVLIVDDVESNLYVAKGMMLLYGLKIDTAGSGFEAIEKVRNGNVYDIIFMDHMMPEMNGMDATKLIRDEGYTNPVVVLTANAVAGAAATFLESGFDGYLSKPIDIRELNSLVNRLIRDKQPPEVLEAIRQQAKQQDLKSTADSNPAVNDELLQTVLMDIENALTVLDELMPKISNGNDDDLNLYATTVHGMKSVLLHIGENELSESAYRLEQAGDNSRIDEILSDTPLLIEASRLVIEKHKSQQENEGTSESAGGHNSHQQNTSENTVLLHEKLLLIKTSCEQYKKKDAKTALEELKEKQWSRKTNELLSEISEYMLYGEFESIIAAIDDVLLAP